MKARHGKLILTLVLGLTTCYVNSQVTAQKKQTATSATSPEDQTIKPGAFILAEIYKTIDVRKAHAGDPFQAKVIADVGAIGKIVLPHGTMLVGRVLEVQPRSETSQESRLIITLDKEVLKDGSEFPLHAVVRSFGKSSHSDVKISSFRTVTVFISTKDDVKLSAHTVIHLQVAASGQ